MNKKDLFKLLALGAGGTIAIGSIYLIYHYLKNNYGFITEQQLKLEDLPKELIQNIVIYELELTEFKKLELIKEYLYVNQDHHADLAGFLLCTTLENSLKKWMQKIDLRIKRSGLIPIMKALRSIDIVTREEYENIKYFTEEVRNNLMHGDKYNRSILKNSFLCIDSFIRRVIMEVNRPNL